MAILGRQQGQTPDEKGDLRDDGKQEADDAENQQGDAQGNLSDSQNVLRHARRIVAVLAEYRQLWRDLGTLVPACDHAETVIPVRDTITSSTVPVVTYALIAANVGAYLYEESLGGSFEEFIQIHGLVPRRLVAEWWDDVTPLFSSMFLHGGWLHLLGNVLYLHIFGDNVEDRLGHVRFVFFYLAAGALAGIAQVLIEPTSSIPIVGASGAIAGVTGAYFLFYPRAKVVTVVPIFLFIQVIEIPAVVFFVLWFGFQLLLGIGSIGMTLGGGIAFWAHIGGFLAGMVLGPALLPRRDLGPRGDLAVRRTMITGV